jgi:quercetin dioxygenase-like cupin family protein
MPSPIFQRVSITRLALTGLLLAGAAAHADVDRYGFVRLAPEDISWKAPNAQGVKNVVLYGDPSKPGMYTVRNTFPPGVMSAPHAHDQDRVVTVIKGTWYTGTDARWDPATTIGMKPGSLMIHPAQAVHFDGAKDEEVIVQITGMGPVKTTYTSPEEGGFGHPHPLK